MTGPVSLQVHFQQQMIQTLYMNIVLNPGETLLTCTVSHFGQGKGIRRVAVVLNYIEKAKLVSGWIAGSTPSRGWMEQRRICSLPEGRDEMTK